MSAPLILVTDDVSGYCDIATGECVTDPSASTNEPATDDADTDPFVLDR